MGDALFIGIDGGGTHCRARIRDSAGRLLGEGKGGPANARLGAAIAMGSVVEAARSAAAAAGLSETALTEAAAGLGLAGAIDETRRHALLAQPHPFSQIVLDSDGYIAWAGAFSGRDGGIIIIGTGSAGLAVVRGRRWNIGGWGNVVSDEGSGCEIGQLAIRRALWAHDGIAEMTDLTRALLARFDDDPVKIVTWADAARPADFAQLAPLVLEHAGRRDALGLLVTEHAATGIARIARRLLELGAPAICLIGGLAEPMRRWLPADLQQRLAIAEGDPIEGAIQLARRAITAPVAAHGISTEKNCS